MFCGEQSEAYGTPANAPEPAAAAQQQPFSLNASLAAANASAAASAVRSFQAAASSAVSAATGSVGGNGTDLPIIALPSRLVLSS